jgi:hypothetical protein
MKHLLMIRSLRKLPPTINSILESSLPYECVSLLASGKQTYKLVSTLENGDNIVKHSLYRQFSDKIFLYITAPMSPPFTKRLNDIPQINAVNVHNSQTSLNDTVAEESYYCYGVTASASEQYIGGSAAED